MPKIARDEDGPHRLDVAMGQRVRERRRALGLSQQDMAEALRVSFQQVQKYESGANRISFSRLVEMAGALKCRLSDLADGLDPDHVPEHLEHVNSLLAADGALEILEAYAGVRSPALRRALVQHARTLMAIQDLSAGETDVPPESIPRADRPGHRRNGASSSAAASGLRRLDPA